MTIVLRSVLLLLLAATAPLASALRAAPASETPPIGTLRALGSAPAPSNPDLVTSIGDQWLLFANGEAWSRTTGQTTWTPLSLPPGLRLSPGSSVTAQGDSLLVIDGTSAFRLRLSGQTLETSPLPDLPEARTETGLTLLGNRLLVVGGRDAAGTARAETWVLDLASETPAWSPLADYPRGPVIRPAAASHYNEAWFLGGRDAAGNPLAEAWSYRFRPIDGTTATGWLPRAAAPAPVAQATILPAGTAHFIVLSPGSASPLVFNTVIDAWFQAPDLASFSAIGYASAGTLAKPRVLSLQTGEEFALDLAKSRYGLSWIDYLAIGLYFVAMVWVGLALSGKGETSAQFALGNRDVKWWAAGISMFATGASSISFMAIPALAFSTNLVMFFPGLMMIAGFFISAYLIYPLLRKLEITSTYEYLHRRFNRGLRLLASAQCILFQTVGRMSVILVLPSLAISAFTGLDVVISVLLMGVLTTIYTAIGGFNAVIWTDVFQGVLMIAAPILVIGYALAGSGGDVATTWQTFESYEKLRLVVTDWNLALPVVWFLLLGALYGIGAGVGDQPVIQRVFSVPMNQVRRTAFMSTMCGIVISIFTYGMGLAIFAFYQNRPQDFAPSVTNDQIVPLFIVQNLPAGICGLVIASIFAAAMSTLSSSMNSVATLVCEDFYKPLFPNSSDASRVRLMKVVSYGVGAVGTGVALLMAKQDISSMFATWNTIVALLGGGFGGIYILGVFTTRTNSIGAISGGLASIVATIWVNNLGAVHWAALTPFAITVCLVVGYVVSILTGGSRKDLAGLTAFTAKAAPRSTV